MEIWEIKRGEEGDVFLVGGMKKVVWGVGLFLVVGYIIEWEECSVFFIVYFFCIFRFLDFSFGFFYVVLLVGVLVVMYRRGRFLVV